jgi:hypothetical protein
MYPLSLTSEPDAMFNKKKSKQRQVKQRRSRQLIVEHLDARLAFDGTGCNPFFFPSPPPSTYMSEHTALEVARLAWEFDEWNNSDIGRGPFERSEDCRVSIEDGHALLAFVAPSTENDLLLRELESLNSRIVASGVKLDELAFSSAWIPLASLKSLKDLVHVSYVSFESTRNLADSGWQADTISASVTSDTSQSIGNSEESIVPRLDTEDVLRIQASQMTELSGPLREIWVQSKVQSNLRSRDAFASDAFASELSSIYQVEGGRVLILASSAINAGMELSKQLTSLGGEVTSANETYVNAWVPVEALPEIGNLPGLTIATAETYPLKMVGNTDSQGDALIRADGIRTRFGVTGTGQNVGVLSDSYNRLGGAAADIASGDLTAVTVVAESVATTNTDEGRAMLQIVRDVAPGANLLFATANGGQANFANNIQALFNQGARVIVDDIVYLAEPMFLDGLVARAADQVTAQGATYVSSAGNLTRSYESQGFTASNVTRNYGRGLITLMDFDPGVGIDAFQQITVPANVGFSIILQWQDPFRSVAPASTGTLRDLDLLVYDTAGTTLITSSTTSVIGQDPIEIATVAPSNVARTLNIALGGVNVAGINRIKYILTNNQVSVDQFATASPTAWGHTNAAGTISVGATNSLAFSNPPVLQNFSARGGIPILFDNAGNLLPQPVIRQTPDIVGPDTVNNTFFGVDSPLDTDTFPNFAGTSASAPHIAALAALIRQVRPGVTPDQIRTALTSTAIDMGVAGFDNESGFGFANGLSAVYSSFTPQTAPDLTSGSDSGLSNGDDITNSANPVFQGTAPVQSFVRLFINGVLSSSVQLGAGVGTYTLSALNALASGSYTATVTFAEANNTAQSFMSPGLAFTVDRDAPTFGGVLDLLASADSGISSLDNITRFTPVFSASGASPYLRLYRNGSVIADYFANSGSLSTSVPSQGSNSYQLFALDLAGNQSSASSFLSVVYDTISPSVSLPQISPDPRSSPISSYNFSFSETGLVGFDLTDLTLQRNSGANLLTASQTVSLVGGIWTLSNLSGLTAAVGNYSLSLNTSTSGISDTAGNSLVNVGTLVETWSVFVSWQNPVRNEDVDGDGVVSPLDVLMLINFINAFGAGSVVNNPNLPAAPPPYYDVNNDQFISPLDVLQVINYINAGGSRIAPGSEQSKPKVSINLKVTDTNGNSVDSLKVGQEYLISGFAEEASGQSILGAYADVRLSDKFDIIQISDLAGSSRRAPINLGGLSNGVTGPLQLFTIRVRANSAGMAVSKALRPSSELLDAAYVIGWNEGIKESEVDYGTLRLRIR